MVSRPRDRCYRSTGHRSAEHAARTALELTAWLQTLALHQDRARRWEPKTLRLYLFSIPARIVHHACRTHLRLSRHHPGTNLLLTALDRLQPG
ncbi:transposase [Nocardia aurantia]|uniref:transposase n=1 Tax=Nocardia aurantia TaxID=2585199 RepID=UPI0018864503